MAEKDSPNLQRAREILRSYSGKPMNLSDREKVSIELAGLMLDEALRVQTKKERQTQEELGRMMLDRRGKSFTMMMTDECFRSKKTKRIADQLIYLLERFGVPRYVSWFKRTQLSLFVKLGRPLHFLLVPLAVRALRKTTSEVILPGEKGPFTRHMKKRREEGVRLNLNYLGEAILGEKEAVKRLYIYRNALRQKEIDYVSIKISTIFSQIDVLDWDRCLEILKERLKILYTEAKNHSPHKFVNLDMEEYRDLHLTKDLFMQVLGEEEFLDFSAGIVLQAYIPDSLDIFKELTEWAKERMARGGAPIKVRIVKGANLAMEQFEAGLHNWPQTPYKSKVETDANYKRMLKLGCEPSNAHAVHLGIASHNLFDIAYAMILRTENQVEGQAHFEMLEGMADHIRRVVQDLSGDMLLYCPVAKKEDFQSAIAYLIRRLDENTGAENFLRHSFGLKPGTDSWVEQVNFFADSCGLIDKVSAEPRRTQNRNDPPQKFHLDAPFVNEQDTDFVLSQNHRFAHSVIETWKNKTIDPIPLVIGGKEVMREQTGEGLEPSSPHATLYEYALATWEDLDQALNIAVDTQKNWAARSAEERASLIHNVAAKMREKRGDLIGVMMKDGGKTVHETEPEISEAIDFAEYYIRSMLELDAIDELSFSPLGTILVTPPWNFPVSIPTGGIVAALITGNTVLFKPAPEAVLSGWILVNLFWEAGIPKEALQFVNCVDDPIGSELIKDERVNAVILTGGTATARHFMKLRPTLNLAAETGGKNAMIITALADRDLAIKDLIHSAFGHSGQKCSAASLAIVEAEVYDDPTFFAQLKDAVESLQVGNCWNPSSKVIPLINPPSGDLLKGLTKLERGEKWLVKPEGHPNNPNLWSPGVKIGVRPGSYTHQTEFFGPLLAVMRATDFDEAISLANSTPYGLTSGLQSLDRREINVWQKKIMAGNCYINRGITGAIVQRQPFGGCKASSFGHGAKAGGPNYIAQFLHKEQKNIPKEKSPIAPSINSLTALLDQIELSSDHLGMLFASLSNYSHWAKHYAKDHDPSKILGQDNILRYRPRKRMAYRVQKNDNPIDLFRIIAGALACKVILEISYTPNATPVEIGKRWHHLLPQLPFTGESEEEFIARLQWGSFERVRFASEPSSDIYQAATISGTFLDTDPVLASGRFELLHYLREVAISIDYHRYGNLGTREGEARTPIQ